jgi:hypothetical protein
MSVSGDYAQPVNVNGYVCWNCSQVADAKKGVDPADVKPGESAAQAQAASNTAPASAVVFGGALAGSLAATSSVNPSTQATATGLGAWLNIAA